MSQVPIVPNEEQAPSGALPQSPNGIDWNGPAGFWIAVIAMIAAVTTLGLFLV